MPFTQIMTLHGVDAEALKAHVARWHDDQAGVAPGYLGARVLADDDDRYLIEVDFTSEEDARRNNDRSETAQWAEELKRMADGQPTYQNLREVASTYRD
jgi:hypothetical protein